MGSLSIWHWLIVLVIIMLVFGTKKLRNIGSDLGGAVKGFKDGMSNSGDKPAEAAPAAPAQQVATNPPSANKDAIDVEAKAKH